MKSKSLTCKVPKLRFPEFRDTPEWEEKTLSNLSTIRLSNGVFNDPKKVGSGYKLVNVSDMYLESTINEKTLSLIELSENEFLKNKVENGDIFFTRSSLVKSGIACSNIYLGTLDNVTFDGHLIRFRPNKKVAVPIFINYLLKTSYIRNQLVARGKTATMTTIGQSDVAGVKLFVPPLTAEQQKIADCLSSLDNLITAQSKKVEALKTHKKGLMQQLFPQEGDTKPKLRFPEFKDAPEWEEKKLGERTHSISSGKDKNTSDGIYDLYGSTGIIGKTLNNSYQGTFILVARVGANAGFLTKAKGSFGVTDNTLVVDLQQVMNIDFVFNILEKFGLNKLIFGSGQPLITGKQLKELPLYFPIQKEQQKIADCLSAADELITSATQKLQALKEHKKGLMQKLFPSSEAK